VLILLSGCIQPPEPPGPENKCGDGVCDAKETANPAICPQDCETEEQTCSQQGGDICSSGEVCVGKLLHASDTTSCCSGTCSLPLGDSCGDGICQSNENPGNCQEDCGDDPEPPGNEGEWTNGKECERRQDCEEDYPTCYDNRCVKVGDELRDYLFSKFVHGNLDEEDDSGVHT